MEPQRQTETTNAAGGHGGISIEIAGADLVFKPVKLEDGTPTGAQLGAAAGFKPNQHATVLHFLPSGELEDVRPLESAKLTPGVPNRFIVVESDRSLRLTIEGTRFDWPCSVISGAQVRKLGAVDASKSIYLERQGSPDMLVADHQLISLEGAGVEAFYGRAQTWELKVQDITLEFATPQVVVRDALVKAGFDVTQEWQIFLKVRGQPKEVVTLTTVVDLRREGIEKLRLTPKDINNGEGVARGRRDFALLEVDEAFLEAAYPTWETVKENGNRWVLIHSYPVPPGYNQSVVSLAMNVPSNYPGAQIDMFYVHSALALNSGQTIPATQGRVEIEGRQYQQWSRHRIGATQWKPASDNVITHLTLVEECLAREVGA